MVETRKDEDRSSGSLEVVEKKEERQNVGR